MTSCWDGDRIAAARRRRRARGRPTATTTTATWSRPTAPAGAAPLRGRRRTGRVVAVTDADGVVEVRNTLRRRRPGRSSRCRRSAAAPATATCRAGSRSSTTTHGGPTNTYVHDDHGRLVGVVDGHGAELTKVYDRWGNPVAVTERDGTTDRQEWDDRGRLVRRVGARRHVGSPSTYDDADRVVEVAAVHRRRHPLPLRGRRAQPRPRSSTPRAASPGWTCDDGLVRRVTDPDGVEVRFGSTPTATSSSITDARRQHRHVERDAAGRVVATVSPPGCAPSSPTTPPAGSWHRRDPDGGGGATSGRAGRAPGRASTRRRPPRAPLRRRTASRRADRRPARPRHHPPLRRRWATSSGVATARRRQVGADLRRASCRLTGVDRPGRAPRGCASTTSPATWSAPSTPSADPPHDHGRRRPGASPAIDDGLTSVGFDYDELGRAVGHRRPDGTERHATHDRCGRIVVDDRPRGRRHPLRVHPRRAAGRGGQPARRRSPATSTTWRGRRVAAVDPTGRRWAFRYDGDGRITRVVAPDRRDRPLPLRRRRPVGGPGRRRRAAPPATSYDAAGRPVGWSTDPTGGVRALPLGRPGAAGRGRRPGGRGHPLRAGRAGRLRTTGRPAGRPGRAALRRRRAAGRPAPTSWAAPPQWEYDPAGRLVRRACPPASRCGGGTTTPAGSGPSAPATARS